MKNLFVNICTGVWGRSPRKIWSKSMKIRGSSDPPFSARGGLVVLENTARKINVPPQTQAYDGVGRKTKPYEYGIGLFTTGWVPFLRG